MTYLFIINCCKMKNLIPILIKSILNREVFLFSSFPLATSSTTAVLNDSKVKKINK
jgi:hypothetical protein